MKKWRVKFKITNQLNDSKKTQVLLGNYKEKPLFAIKNNDAWFFEVFVKGNDYPEFLPTVIQEVESILDVVSFQIMSEVMILEIQIHNFSEIFKQDESKQTIPVTYEEIKDIKNIPKKTFMHTYWHFPNGSGNQRGRWMQNPRMEQIHRGITPRITTNKLESHDSNALK